MVRETQTAKTNGSAPVSFAYFYIYLFWRTVSCGVELGGSVFNLVQGVLEVRCVLLGLLFINPVPEFIN